MSPETAVAANWRKLFAHTYIKQKLVLVAIDEAHCIPEWLVHNTLIVLKSGCPLTLCLYLGVWTSERPLSALVRYEH